MKKIFLLLTAVALLQSCAKVEVDEDNSCSSTVVVGTCPASNVGYAVDYLGKLVCFSLATPQTLAASTEVTGLNVGDWISGLDFRPANGVLYALGYSGQLYTLNPATAVATAVGSPLSFSSARIVMDISPETDVVRAISIAGENRRFNAATGALVATDTDLVYGGADTYTGSTPRIVALAFSNNVASGTPTVLYGLDSTLNTLVTMAPANAGVLNTIGNTGFSVSDITGFDIRTVASVDTGYAITLSGITGMKSDLYTVNLSTGQGTRVETLGGCRAFGFAVGL